MESLTANQQNSIPGHRVDFKSLRFHYQDITRTADALSRNHLRSTQLSREAVKEYQKASANQAKTNDLYLFLEKSAEILIGPYLVDENVSNVVKLLITIYETALNMSIQKSPIKFTSLESLLISFKLEFRKVTDAYYPFDFSLYSEPIEAIMSNIYHVLFNIKPTAATTDVNNHYDKMVRALRNLYGKALKESTYYEAIDSVNLFLSKVRPLLCSHKLNTLLLESITNQIKTKVFFTAMLENVYNLNSLLITNTNLSPRFKDLHRSGELIHFVKLKYNITKDPVTEGISFKQSIPFNQEVLEFNEMKISQSLYEPYDGVNFLPFFVNTTSEYIEKVFIEKGFESLVSRDNLNFHDIFKEITLSLYSIHSTVKSYEKEKTLSQFLEIEVDTILALPDYKSKLTEIIGKFKSNEGKRAANNILRLMLLFKDRPPGFLDTVLETSKCPFAYVCKRGVFLDLSIMNRKVNLISRHLNNMLPTLESGDEIMEIINKMKQLQEKISPRMIRLLHDCCVILDSKLSLQKLGPVETVIVQSFFKSYMSEVESAAVIQHAAKILHAYDEKPYTTYGQLYNICAIFKSHTEKCQTLVGPDELLIYPKPTKQNGEPLTSSEKMRALIDEELMKQSSKRREKIEKIKHISRFYNELMFSTSARLNDLDSWSISEETIAQMKEKIVQANAELAESRNSLMQLVVESQAVVPVTEKLNQAAETKKAIIVDLRQAKLIQSKLKERLKTIGQEETHVIKDMPIVKRLTAKEEKLLQEIKEYQKFYKTRFSKTADTRQVSGELISKFIRISDNLIIKLSKHRSNKAA